jgi:hypothetical protein
MGSAVTALNFCGQYKVEVHRELPSRSSNREVGQAIQGLSWNPEVQQALHKRLSPVHTLIFCFCSTQKYCTVIINNNMVNYSEYAYILIALTRTHSQQHRLVTIRQNFYSYILIKIITKINVT